MKSAIEWFQEKGFTFDDKITIKDVIELQADARADLERDLEEAVELLQPYSFTEYSEQYNDRKKRIDIFLARHRKDAK